MVNVVLYYKPGPNWRGDFYGPGSYDRRFNTCEVHGYLSAASAHVAGFRLFKKGIASSWSIGGTGMVVCTYHSWNRDPTTGRRLFRESEIWAGKCDDRKQMASLEYCPYPDPDEVHPWQPCYYCTWLTTRVLILDVIGCRPVLDIRTMTRSQLFDRFHKLDVCPQKWDSCSPCGDYIGGICQHPDHPDNIIAKRMREKNFIQVTGE